MQEENRVDEQEQKQDESTKADDLEAKVVELEDKLLRAAAECLNIRRCCEKEKADISWSCVADFARDLLRVRDALSLAVATDNSNHPVVEGVKLTLNMMDSVFANYGVKMIESKDREFDPNLHQAMEEIEDSEAVPGTIVKVLQDGFLIKERLLRPSLVGVTKKCG
ncbi:hypothetical protein FACS1894113_0090 [Alphaproteobacteria bacterium]|nr:hypothetical protein FACS1894113_0090 [Alphaproteobacteria bacterium]